MKEIILFEDKDIIVCHKPAGLATQSGRIGQKDLVSILKNHLGKNPYLGVIHRLDQPVEGLLVFAKTEKAAAELSRQLTGNVLNKQYLAVVAGEGFAEETTLTHFLLKDNKTNRSSVVKEGTAGGKKAQLTVRTTAYIDEKDIALTEVKLLTGRHHQIRVQMAAAGFPLLGDSKYGTEKSNGKTKELAVQTVALCANSLIFFHPITKKQMEFSVKPEGAVFQLFL